jgi:hypothetical protein
MHNNMGARMHTSRLPYITALIVVGTAAASCHDATGPSSCVDPQIGDPWEFLGPDSVSIMSLAKTRDGLFAGSRDGVWETNCAQADANWLRWGLDGLSVRSLVPVTVGGGPVRLYASVMSASVKVPVVVSRDAARGWSDLPWSLASRGGSLSLIADASTPGLLVTSIAGGSIVVSRDYGETWTVRSGPSLDPGDPAKNAGEVQAFGVRGSSWGSRLWAAGCSTVDPKVWYSDDVGTTWHGEYVTQDYPHTGNMALSLLVDPDDQDHLYVGLYWGVMETQDAGRTWRVDLTLRHPGYVSALTRVGTALVAVSDETYATGTGSLQNVLGVYVSRDAGETWDPLSVPLTAGGGESALAEDDSTLLIGTSSGVWRVHLP